MAGIYIYADTPAQAACLAGFAKASGKQATAIAVGAAAADFANCGADAVIQLDGTSTRPEDYAGAIAGLLGENGAEMFLGISSPVGRELAGLVAAHAGCALVSDASSIVFDGASAKTQRMMYGGLVNQEEVVDGFFVATCNAGIADPASGEAAISVVAAEASGLVTVLSEDVIPKNTDDLENMDYVICVGNGVAKQEDMAMIEELASRLDAGIVCTRGIAEERKWLPVETYVGISGLNLNNKMYLSVGVSGALQHLYGVRNVKTVVAIDKNEKAPIFDNADYELVGDLYEIVPELIKVL